MPTSKQIAANRRNALNSTGPKSPEGQATVSQNRTVHGLTPVEKQEDYDAFFNRLVETEKTVGGERSGDCGALR